MPLEFLHQDGCIVSITRGDVDYAIGMSQLISALRKARELNPGGRWHFLADIRESTENRTGEELWSMARMFGSHGDVLSGRVAVVVSKDLHQQHTRMFGACVERYGVTMGIFPDLGEAQAWLAGHGMVHVSAGAGIPRQP